MPSCLPHRTIGRQRTVIALSLIAILTACTAGQDERPPAKSAQRDPYFTPISTKTTPYMPRVIIRNIREDRAGNIWFATFGGPIRYDGYVFANFSEEVGLGQTRVFSLLEERSGALWFGSITGGAARYDGKSFTKFTDKEGLGNNDVLWIFEDRDANIWFGTGNGVSRYDGRSITNFTTKDGLIDNSVYTMAQDASGRIWFGTQGGVCSYDGKSFFNLANQVGRSFVNTRSMVVDRAGHLWFGGQEGAFRYDGKTLTTFTSKEGLLDDFVGSMIVDRAGNVWFGHPGQFPGGGGASRYDGKSFTHFTQKDGLGSRTVYCMLEDQAGNIWFGSADAGACRYDGKTFTRFSDTAPPPLPPQGDGRTKAVAQPSREHPTSAKGEIVSELDKAIWYIFQAKNNDYWFGSKERGVYRYDGKTLINYTTRDGLVSNDSGGFQEDKAGNIYITTSELDGGHRRSTQAIHKYDGKTFSTLAIPESTSNNAWKLQPDDLWFGGGQDTGVVYRYDGKSLHRLEFPKTKDGDEHYVRTPRSQYPNAKYSPYDVYTIFKDSKGHLWFGTAVLGACRYDGKSFTWIPESELRNGSFGTRSIIEDKDGKFWFSNTRHRYGIYQNDSTEQQKSVSGFGKEKGIFVPKAPNDEIYFQSSTLDNTGALWMATFGDGVWRYDGNSLTHYVVKDGEKAVTLFSIHKDNQGVMWLGTQSAGAYKFNGKTFEKFKP